ncbi:hypothetical protein HDR60_03955 [bacterium]|nr:hypothetical protein [bacterium]
MNTEIEESKENTYKLYECIIEKDTNRVLGGILTSNPYLEDVNNFQKNTFFNRLRSNIVFKIAKLLKVNISYHSSFLYDCKGKYFHVKNGKLFKNT